MKDLITALQEELNRNRELLRAYENLGSVGVFGASVIRAKIMLGEQAISSGDTVSVVSALVSLRDSE
jgi:hypothetical protein